MSNKNKYNFLEMAEKNERIRSISEAFKEHPVEEEWHKGRIEEYKEAFYKSLK